MEHRGMIGRVRGREASRTTLSTKVERKLDTMIVTLTLFRQEAR
jgi:hypothetical protein